uniref:Uncharacterized protein n=1 Tax=Solanum tuberosum TaxID=4113 RepID=M1DB46_SOLTU
MARGRGRGKGRPRWETILTLGSANEARLEPDGKKKVTPAATHARGTLTEPTPIYATDGVKQLHLSTRATTSKTKPVIATMQQKGEPTSVRNQFSPLSMLWDERDTIPPDKGGQPITQ